MAAGVCLRDEWQMQAWCHIWVSGFTEGKEESAEEGLRQGLELV